MATIKHYLEGKGLSQESIETEYRQLLYFIDWCEEHGIEPEQVTHGELLSYIKHLQQRSVKQITVQKYLNSIKHYYNWQIGLSKREDNPVINLSIKGVKRKKLYGILKHAELETLYQSYCFEENETHKNQNWYRVSELSYKRNKVLLGLLIYQGLSAMELSRLKVTDLKLREGKIHIGGSRKSNERTLKLEAVQIMDMMEYSLQTRTAILGLTHKQSDHLFISTGKGQKLGNTLQQLIKRLKAINNKVENLQQIRTSVIIYWLKRYNLREAQYMAGHRYVSSTESYLINDLDDLQEDITKFHPITE